FWNHAPDIGEIDPLLDEYDLARTVRVRPALEPRQIVQEMLRSLDYGGALGLLGNVDDTLHAQQIGAEIPLQGVEQQPQRLARDRFFPHEAKRSDVAVVQGVMV